VQTSVANLRLESEPEGWTGKNPRKKKPLQSVEQQLV
jgi:hypothetical protein